MWAHQYLAKTLRKLDLSNPIQNIFTASPEISTVCPKNYFGDVQKQNCLFFCMYDVSRILNNSYFSKNICFGIRKKFSKTMIHINNNLHSGL